ncbi:HAD domain-containing protein [Alicyclobacillus sp. SO9]|uniref:HAD domain-containing protein n=1 Tax=Alicyclobacillus sp. SO9 TaxID=2665646 RepID=UPI0018E83A46|nr:HAD domain-containing protein [Alicyclobacillus sp. SO9]QQE81212.1 hypothetical protein GI364_09620 [Alicyclobacillus sp. SO9]
MKVIFLDIDGVLVTSRHFVQSQKYFGHEFDPVCVENLKLILSQTNAKIVVSSSWREGRTLKNLEAIFDANGLENCLVGQTPLLEFGTREDEIQTYIDEMRGTEFEVQQFVIIDDEEEMNRLVSHLVRTDFQTGLTSETVLSAVEHLG